MDIITMFVAISLGLLAIPLLLGKGGFLIAGYNMMPDEKRAKYNEKRVCRSMGVMLLILITCIVSADALYDHGMTALSVIARVVWIFVLVAFLIWANTAPGKRFFMKKN